MDAGDVRRIEAEPLDEAQVARLLRGVTAAPPLGLTGEADDEFRLSIAGAQEKTALLRLEGPRCLAVLAGGERPPGNALMFAEAQLAFWLLTAPDGHAKNFSVFLRRRGYVLTPLYDVLSAWPIVGPGPNEWPVQKVRLAMALRGKSPHRELHRIAIRHWRALALQTGVPDAFTPLLGLVERADAALAAVERELPPDFPPRVWDRIAAGVRAQRTRFLDGIAADA